MSALPLPQLPPPDTPDGHGPNPGAGSVRAPRHEHAGPPVPATVRLCPVDPAADADEIATATVSMITTTHTAPGNRTMLADDETPATGSSRTRRDRLAESVLRLGRGTTATPDHRAHGDHASATARGGLPSAPGPESGPGPGDLAEPVTNPTDQQPLDESPGGGSDSGKVGDAAEVIGLVPADHYTALTEPVRSNWVRPGIARRTPAFPERADLHGHPTALGPPLEILVLLPVTAHHEVTRRSVG